MIERKKKEGESVSSLIFAFGKQIKRSGLQKEVRKRKNRSRPKNKNSRHKAALYRTKKNEEITRTKKYGGEHKKTA